ncbi:MAG TPA: response regulator [Ktedonobacteraceae bacterium]|nr:response regulator [Ktedonobacteraceae bacterium]
MSAIEYPPSMDAALPVKTILVVEDDNSIGAFLELAILQETRYHPLLVSSSAEAVKAVQGIRPDLFLLDYFLQRTTGITLYDELHAMDGFEDIPAIIFTAGNLEQYQQEVEQRHIIAMSKPIELDKLLTTIKNILEKRTRGDTKGSSISRDERANA